VRSEWEIHVRRTAAASHRSPAESKSTAGNAKKVPIESDKAIDLGDIKLKRQK
jgi:hypothetical protein